VISDIGDDDVIRTCKSVGMVPTVLTVTQAELAQLTYDLGRQNVSESPLSSMALLWTLPTSVQIVSVPGATINDAVARAYAASGPSPTDPSRPNSRCRSSSCGTGRDSRLRPADYRTACTHNTRPGELPLLHRLERMTFTGPRAWLSWANTRFGTLKVAVTNIWETLEGQNPKLLAL
jgi:hypothetical protein